MSGTRDPRLEHVRPHEAAALLGMRAADVYRAIDARQLDACREGNRLVISRASIERLNAQRLA